VLQNKSVCAKQLIILDALYMFRDVVENVGLEGHFHVDSAGDPNQLALSDVEHTVDFMHLISANLLVTF